MRVRELSAGRPVDVKWDGNVAVFATAPGATYVVDRASDPFESHAAPAVAAKPATGPRKHTGLGPRVVAERGP
jgi:hypothetical protein